MKPAPSHSLLVLALTFAACHRDSTGVAPEALAIASLASMAAEEAPRYSDWSAPVNLGPPVNTTFMEQGVSISKGGLRLYFQSDRPGGLGETDIYVSQRACTDAGDPACAWQTPANLGPTINTSSFEGNARETIDGHRLYFASTRPGGFGANDLYVSGRRDKRDAFSWQPAVNLGGGVNTAANDFQPDPFEDDETGTTLLFFASDRPGGAGLLDIYVSTLRPDGTFGPAATVAELNTPFFDQQPAIRRDGLELFFASNRPGTVGSIDLWVTTRASTANPWSTPVNLGPIVNTTTVDARPALSFDGTELYFQSLRPGGLGSFDLYRTTRTKLKGPD